MKKIINYLSAATQKYIGWADRWAKKMPMDEDILRKSVEKGNFKTIEEAKRSSMLFWKGVFLGTPIVFLLILGFVSSFDEDSSNSNNPQDTSSNTNQTTELDETTSSSAPNSEDTRSLENSNTSEEVESPEIPREVDAQIQKTGLDFQYDLQGESIIKDDLVIVNYYRELQQKTQLWEIEFDLNDQTWQDSVTENGETYSWSEGTFTMEEQGGNITLYADVLDIDGSLIVRNGYVVTYPKQ